VEVGPGNIIVVHQIPSDGEFEYFLDEKKLCEEMRIEGTYILITNDPETQIQSTT